MPVRVSDHDPVRLSIGVPAFRSADLSLTASAANDSVHVGESAGFTVDQSAKYERVAVCTWEALRRKGLGTKAACKVVRAVADQGRIPCTITDRRDAASLKTAAKLGFNRRALMTSYVTTFKK